MDAGYLHSRRRVVLLIDGENMPAEHWPAIWHEAQQHGTVAIRRVYGNVGNQPGWAAMAGLPMVHCGPAGQKNSTDIKMVVDAMELAYMGDADVFVIASTESDFSHLAHHLREKGHSVIGVGKPNARAGLVHAYERFVPLYPVTAMAQDVTYPATPEARPAPVIAAAPSAEQRMQVQERVESKPLPLSKLDGQIAALIRKEGGQNGLPMQILGPRMDQLHGVRIKDLTDSTWRKYFSDRSHLYDCDPRGPDACVRWVGPELLRVVRQA